MSGRGIRPRAAPVGLPVERDQSAGSSRLRRARAGRAPQRRARWRARHGAAQRRRLV